MVFILFCAFSCSWTDEMLAIAFEIGMCNATGEFRQRIIDAFELQGETIEHAAESATWTNRVERQPYNIKSFHHWHFQKTPINPDGMDVVSKYYSDGADCILNDNIQMLTSHRASTPWAFILNFKLLLGTMCDVHSVFHLTELFNQEFLDGDDNANKFMVKFGGKTRSLLSVWENGCGEFSSEVNWKKLNSTVDKLLKETPIFNYDISFLNYKNSVKKIKEETIKLTKDYGYADLRSGSELSNSYIEKCKEVTKTQVVKAGYALQDLFNKISFETYGNYQQKSPTTIRKSEVIAWTLFVFLFPSAIIIVFHKFFGE